MGFQFLTIDVCGGRSMPQHAAYEHITFRSPCCPVVAQRSLQREDPHFPLACHREAEFQLVKQGHGAYLIAGKRCSFAPSTLVFIPPKRVHRLIPDPGVTLDRFSLVFLAVWLSPDRAGLRRLAALPQRIALTAAAAAGMDLVLRRLEAEIGEQNSGWENMVRLLLREFLALVERAREHAPPVPAVGHPVLPAIVSFIDAHFAEELGTEAIARRAGFSSSHLSRLFKRHTGLGIKQYVLHRRVLEAKRWLEESPALTVTAISEKVGFSDFALFNRAFKAIACATPSGYRAIVRSKEPAAQSKADQHRR